MWANSVWGLASAALACLLGYPAMADHPIIQEWLLVGTLVFAAACIMVLIWPLRKRLKVEPIHIIVLGLLVAAGGVVWQWRHQTVSGASPIPAMWTASPPPPSQYGIAWNFDDPSRKNVYFLAITKNPGQETTVTTFQASGVNTSADPISCKAGYVLSDLTGDRLPLFFYIDDERVPVDQVRPIPPTVEFQVIGEHFSTLFPGSPQQVPISKFLTEFGGFSFVFDCNTGTYRHRFSVQDIRELVNKLEAQAIPKPRLSKKP
jgi:hypothetical protein